MWSIFNLQEHEDEPLNSGRRMLRGEPHLFYTLDMGWHLREWSEDPKQRRRNKNMNRLASAVEMAALLNSLELEPLSALNRRRQVAKIWYQTPEQEGLFMREPEKVRLATLEQTHALLMKLEIYPDRPDLMRVLNDIYDWLQGENWSPDGQARPLLEEKGLSHTSMSIGDVIQIGGEYYVVMNFGFARLKELESA